MAEDDTATITLDGQSYAVADLSPLAQETLQSLRFVAARLQQLQGEMAVSQTAHVAYARALRADLDGNAPGEAE